jgi:hypothetical protein
MIIKSYTVFLWIFEKQKKERKKEKEAKSKKRKKIFFISFLYNNLLLVLGRDLLLS